MRSPPDPADRPSTASFTQPPTPELPTDIVGAGSSLVTLQPVPLSAAKGPKPGTDEAPTIITPVRPPEAEIPAAAGSKLGHYEIIEAIGAGGMAAVLKARDTELGRVVALKILPPHMARDPENVTRFKQEARAAARLDHDNIARVFFCGEDRGLQFIAFEFVDGDNLRVVMDKRGLVPPADCVRYMLHVTAGLGHAAARGVVHRDIKPSNIIVTKDGRAKIVDMGLARAMGTHSMNGGVTQSGMTLGTFDYISPEQALDPRRADIRSDIYSLGCAFYHALTGRPVVPEGTAAKKLHAHQFEPVTDPRVLNPAVPDDLAAVLAKMMAKDPARRYQTPADLAADLAAVAERLHVSTEGLPADGSSAPSTGRIAGLSAEPPRLPLGLIAGVVGVGLAVAVLLGVSSGPARPPAVAPWDDSFAQPKGPPTPDTSTSPNPAPTPGVTATVKADTTEQFVKALATRGVTEIQLDGGKRYDLTAETAGVLVWRKRVAVVGVGAKPPVVRLAAVPVDPARPGDARPGTLTVARCEAVRFDRVSFEIVDGGDPAATRDDPVGVAVTDTPKVEFVRCRFEADKDLPATVTGLAVANGSADTPAVVTIANSYFAVRRSVGVRLAGRVRADVSESGFAPHVAAFQLKGVDGPPASELALRHCTFLLENKDVVADADDAARWDVTAAFCVFAAPPPADADPGMMNPPTDRRPAVLRVATDRADVPAARFAAKPASPNAYYRVDPFAAGGRGYSFDDAKKWKPPPATDPAAVVLAKAPWAATNPVDDLVGDAPWQALRLQTTIRAIRRPGTEVGIFGVRASPSGEVGRTDIYPVWPPVFETETLPARVKLWWPEPPDDVKGNLPRGAFESLADAIKALKPGDELQVRHTGPVAVPPTTLALKFPLAIKPDPKYAPVLVPAAKQGADGRLFQLDGGELRLEGLEIRLRAKGEALRDVRTRAAVVVNAGRCVLLNCVVTADDGDGADPDKVAAVAVADPDGEMKPTGPDGSPEVRIENCLLRGATRGVWVQAARPADVQITNTVAVLSGPLLDVDAPARPLNGGAVHAKFARVTAVSSGPLLEFHTGRPAGTKAVAWAPVQVVAERCVFAGVGAAGPVLSVTGTEAAADVEKYLGWRTGDGPNWYPDRVAATAVFAELAPADDAVTPKQVHGDGWFAFTGEKPAAAGKVTFAAPLPTRRLAAVRPADFKVSETDIPGTKPADAGADVGKVAGPGE